ncbi:hypothetical protein QM480_09055 [Flectobacillus sp. DC10W]|uniref:Holin n=1 Tax=Flectobacillus longus TaxID=2984207 RepID=A0ABT6YLK5_9BACT|nr:hypothetical protein [Flectobacillus longus]MDI9864472.1 hypothetical protein [Flectobacillus longus]
MNWIQSILSVLKGVKDSTALFDYKRILQEVLVSILVSVLVWVILKPFKIEDDTNSRLLSIALTTQRKLDSLNFQEKLHKQQAQIDSLNRVIILHHENDSLRSNARLSKLDAIRAINKYITNSSKTEGRNQ